MIALDLLLTIYQGALLIYVMKKQFVQRPHSILYEVSGVLSFTFFLLLIQYLHLPIPDSLAILIPFLYIKCTSHERLMTCVLWTLLDGFLFLGTLTLVSSLFDIQIGVNGGVLAASDETQMIYNFSVKISIPLENTGVPSVFATSVWPFSLIFSLARRNEGNFFQAVPTTLSSSLAEVRLASLVAWA